MLGYAAVAQTHPLPIHDYVVINPPGRQRNNPNVLCVAAQQSNVYLCLRYDESNPQSISPVFADGCLHTARLLSTDSSVCANCPNYRHEKTARHPSK
jgi:hypothetical protein